MKVGVRMSHNINVKDNILKLRGRIEIVDKNGNNVLTEDNLVLMTSRLLILQLLFQDSFTGKISTGSFEDISNYISDIHPYGNIRRRICGFQLGNGGIRKESPYTPYVPSYDETSLKSPLSFISLDASGNIISNEYDDLTKIINKPSVTSDGNICSNNTVKYFDKKDDQGNNKYYAKSFDDNDSRLYVNNGKISYTVKLDVETQDLQGQYINELGLVIADCTYGNDNLITNIQNPKLATRVTFTTQDLSTSLLSSFSIYYTIFI